MNTPIKSRSWSWSKSFYMHDQKHIYGHHFSVRHYMTPHQTHPCLRHECCTPVYSFMKMLNEEKGSDFMSS